MDPSVGTMSQTWQLAPMMVRKVIWAVTCELVLGVTAAELASVSARHGCRLVILQWRKLEFWVNNMCTIDGSIQSTDCAALKGAQ